MKVIDSGINIFDVVNEAMKDAMVECVEEIFETLKNKDASKEEMDMALEMVRDILCIFGANFNKCFDARLSSLMEGENDEETRILA